MKIMNMINLVVLLIITFTMPPLAAQEAAKQNPETVDMSGISIIGNRELPKTLFIVPWKNSAVGVETELTNTLNEGLQPLDPEVFVRELNYYDFSRKLK